MLFRATIKKAEIAYKITYFRISPNFLTAFQYSIIEIITKYYNLYCRLYKAKERASCSCILCFMSGNLGYIFINSEKLYFYDIKYRIC